MTDKTKQAFKDAHKKHSKTDNDLIGSESFIDEKLKSGDLIRVNGRLKKRQSNGTYKDI